MYSQPNGGGGYNPHNNGGYNPNVPNNAGYNPYAMGYNPNQGVNYGGQPQPQPMQQFPPAQVQPQPMAVPVPAANGVPYGQPVHHFNFWAPTIQQVQFTLPQNMQIKYSESGVPYYTSTDGSLPQDSPMHTKLNKDASLKDIGEWAGTGIRLLLEFERFIAVTNILSFILALINIIPGYSSAEVDGVVSHFSIGHYGSSVAGIWRLTTLINAIMWFSFPFLYFRSMKVKLKDMKSESLEGTIYDEIKENRSVGFIQRFFRIIVAYITLSCLIFLVGIVSFKLTDYFQGSTVGSFVLSGIISTVNFLGKKFTRKLTLFEKHKTYTGLQVHNTFKLFAYKVSTVVAMYIAKYAVYNGDCYYNDIAKQIATLMITDLVVFNGLELLAPVLAKCKEGSDGKPLDLADEFLEVIYRQFIVYSAIIFAPALSLFAFFINWVEFKIDRYKIMNQMYIPRKNHTVMNKSLAFYLLIDAAIAFLGPPNGVLHMLFRNTSNSKFATCNILG
ncbi:hypothetical protein PCE1_000718 [Barthelona sp. PCE]